MRKTGIKRNRAALMPILVTSPFDRVAMDVLGPLPMSENRNKYVIVFGEYLKKYVTAVALLETTTEIMLHFGAPLTQAKQRPRAMKFDQQELD
uniref:Uncharacterized protein n=1 Tax=Romanomermis culicivorax TaxID=13658 RepID=A0A915L9R7_ROMCU